MPLTGFASKDLLNGVRYVAIHYTADEAKRGEWSQQMRATGIDSREWNREMELMEDVYDGVPVYADYIDQIHATPNLHLLAGAKQFGGWDCGQTLIPAYIHLQVTPDGQVQALFEVVSLGDDAMETFAPKVSAAIISNGLEICRRDIDHRADATVNQRSGTRKETAAQVAAEHGFNLHGSSNAWEPRRSAVAWLLTRRLPDGRPGFVIDRDRCPVLRQGFQGAYKFEQSPSGDTQGPGRILTSPLKNAFSHIHDALQYPAMKIRDELDKQAKGRPTGLTKQRRYV